MEQEEAQQASALPVAAPTSDVVPTGDLAVNEGDAQDYAEGLAALKIGVASELEVRGRRHLDAH